MKKMPEEVFVDRTWTDERHKIVLKHFQFSRIPTLSAHSDGICGRFDRRIRKCVLKQEINYDIGKDTPIDVIQKYPKRVRRKRDKTTIIRSKSVPNLVDVNKESVIFFTIPRLPKFRRVNSSSKTILIRKNAQGYGFIVRGLKANGLSSSEKSQQPFLQYVYRIEPDSPADLAGLKANDYIKEINTVDVSRGSHEEVISLINSSTEKIILTIVRMESSVYEHLDDLNTKGRKSDSEFYRRKHVERRRYSETSIPPRPNEAPPTPPLIPPPPNYPAPSPNSEPKPKSILKSRSLEIDIKSAFGDMEKRRIERMAKLEKIEKRLEERKDSKPPVIPPKPLRYQKLSRSSSIESSNSEASQKPFSLSDLPPPPPEFLASNSDLMNIDIIPPPPLFDCSIDDGETASVVSSLSTLSTLSSMEPDKTINDWSIVDVADWLDRIQMSEYKENFVYHKINGTVLADLGRDELQEIGVHHLGDKVNLEKAIKREIAKCS
ncbi:DgyrCDS8154 [Dimorphilus gyrociliatus]|uniref:DgyrCDS8154 n=1 Tax=Dimorphilus gyrociliatus TaxID=2664684 RepID=A0A7I8VTD3_9ANNE|nr:DgyrCDS8154 [Dimorphilus gyrociliatus]